MPWSPNPISKRARQLPRDWNKIRARVLARDHHTCVLCGQPGTHVDHIQRGQDHRLTNLRTLCQACHMARTGRDGGTAPRRKRRRARTPEPHPGLINPNMQPNA